MRLDLVHEVMQVAFGWHGYHLHAFETVCGEFGAPDDDGDWSDREDEATAALAQVAAAEKAKVVNAYGTPDLTDFQLDVARLFFSLPASKGFLLAGGATLLAQHLTTRPTEDLDFFTAPERGHVPTARDALEAAARERGWRTERIHDSDTFCRRPGPPSAACPPPTIPSP